MKKGDKVACPNYLNGTFVIDSINSANIALLEPCGITSGNTSGKWKHAHICHLKHVEPEGLYVCHVLGRGEPTKIHKTLAEAKEEAERLARKRNKEVRVLKVLGAMKPQEQPVIWEEI